MSFFRHLAKSIYNPEFYRSLTEKPFSFSMKYFLKFALLIAILGTIVIGVRGVIPSPAKFREMGDRVVDLYPDELVITFKDGKVSTNVEEPYYIKLPQDSIFRDDTEDAQDTLDNILVINTRDAFTIESFRNYHTMALLTEDSLIVGDKGEMRIVPVASFPLEEINKEYLEGKFNKIKPYFVLIVPALLLFMALMLFAVIATELIYLLFSALLIWGLLAILKRRTGYKGAYQIGLHAVTLPIILDGIMFAISPIRYPFVFTILMLVLIFINVFPRKSELTGQNQP